MASRVPSADTLDRIARFAEVITDPDRMAPYLKERRERYFGRAPAVVLPATTDAVARVVRFANDARLPIVPQGGNTGLVGGQVPDGSGTQIVLSLERLNQIRSVDAPGDVMIVDLGVTLAAARAAAAGVDRLFPLSLAAEAQAQIGGVLSTNAGGLAVLAYGTARDLALGLEVVLASGEVWSGLRTLRKDNTGYDLKQLFIGAEGTLGIITAASLKLFPRPRGKSVAMLAVETPAAALKLLNLGKEIAGNGLTSFELMPRIGVEFVIRHTPDAREPLRSRAPWYVLLEVSSGLSAPAATALTESIAEAGLAEGFVSDFVTTPVHSEVPALSGLNDAAARLWRIREALPDAQTPEGGSIKHDVSVPVSAVPEFIAAAAERIAALAPGARPVPFGHLGDGNIHFNISQPEGADKAAFLARWEELSAAVHAVAASFGGSISAEHGIGQMKRALLPKVKTPVEMALMWKLKQMLDPNGILNPGKLL